MRFERPLKVRRLRRFHRLRCARRARRRRVRVVERSGVFLRLACQQRCDPLRGARPESALCREPQSERDCFKCKRCKGERLLPLGGVVRARAIARVVRAFGADDALACEAGERSAERARRSGGAVQF